METPQKIFVAIGTVAVVGLALVGGKVLFGGDTAATQGPTKSSSSSVAPSTSATTQSTNQSTGSTNAASSTASGYKDGQYTATQSYYVPHGVSNSVAVTLTIANGKISAVKTDDQYTDGESSMYVSGFESEVSSDASGQSLSSYSPSRIGGASLTTEAFAQALDTIRSQAAA